MLSTASTAENALAPTQACPVCGGPDVLLDVVDFNKSCDESRGNYLPLVGLPVYYRLCGTCGFCYAPELYRWSLKAFAERIYNDEYIRVDPDYVEYRPRENAAHLQRLLGDRAGAVRHLDYGGGQGLLSEVLQAAGWDSKSYDPFVDTGRDIGTLGQFELITAYEVFEHVPDVRKLMDDLAKLLVEDGVVLFTTLLSDGNLAPNTRLTWWYASPRNGHISLFSRESLQRLAAAHGLHFASASEGSHVFWRSIPEWAGHFLRA